MDSTVLYKVWYNRVLGTGRYREALTEFNRALALDPNLAEAKAFQESQKLQSIADLDGYTEVPEPRSYQPRWVCLEGMNRDELAAYDYGATSAEQAVKRILDGQDKGEGCANEPWETLRQRLLTLVVERHQHALNLAKAEKLLSELVEEQRLRGVFYLAHTAALNFLEKRED